MPWYRKLHWQIIIGLIAGTIYGIVAAANACGQEAHLHYNAIPAVIFTHPEIAMVGLTAEEAQEKGLNINIGTFPFQALGKSVALLYCPWEMRKRSKSIPFSISANFEDNVGILLRSAWRASDTAIMPCRHGYTRYSTSPR